MVPLSPVLACSVRLQIQNTGKDAPFLKHKMKASNQKLLEYVPKTVSRKDAPVVIKTLKEIETKHGLITPLAVIQAARHPKSALHKFFTWDDRKAADKYRLVEARQLICSVYVRHADSEESVPVRAFVNIKVDGEEEESHQGYVSQNTMLRAPNLQQQILTYARNQLLLWRSKFGHLEAFYGISKAIDEIVAVDKDNAA